MSYNSLEEVFGRVSVLQHLGALAEWDLSVFMPSGGLQARSQAMAEVSLMTHELLSSAHMADWISAAQMDQASLTDWQRQNLKCMARKIAQLKAVDPDLTKAKIVAANECEAAWRTLRKNNNWEDLLPKIKKVFECISEEATQRSKATGKERYDSLLDLYEPELTSKKIDVYFSTLRSELPHIFENALSRSSQRSCLSSTSKFPSSAQKALGESLMQKVGFDFKHGRLDESTHPFCGGVPDDVRITTRYREDNFIPSLMGVLHETGHACYEQNLPNDWRSQPVGMSLGMALHEGQSLFFEMQVTRRKEFIEFALPEIIAHLGSFNSDKSYFSVENLMAHVTKVERSYIRVDADEVSYPFHIILRYEIERAIMDGSVKVEEIPAIWNEKMKSYLGLQTVGNFKDGCLQDIHWPSGLFGYFPNYTLGAMIAAQNFATLKKQVRGLEAKIQKGEFSEILSWLKTNIWSWGSYHDLSDLLKNATGEDLNPRYFLDHLKARYC